jgi:hypothetical protein
MTAPMPRTAIDRELRMRIATITNQTVRLRAVRHIVLCGVFSLVGCQDATSPEDANPPTPNAPNLITSIGNNTTPLGTMGATLVDATNWVLPSINSENIRSSMEVTLQSLANHIGASQYELARKDVTTARDLITNLNAVDYAEVGPIGVSLDEIDAGLKKISY